MLFLWLNNCLESNYINTLVRIYKHLVLIDLWSCFTFCALQNTLDYYENGVGICRKLLFCRQFSSTHSPKFCIKRTPTVPIRFQAGHADSFVGRRVCGPKINFRLPLVYLNYKYEISLNRKRVSGWWMIFINKKRYCVKRYDSKQRLAIRLTTFWWSGTGWSCCRFVG